MGEIFLLHLYKECRTGAHKKLKQLWYGPYTITNAMGDNYFDLNIPLFLGLHLVFNVDSLWPYFPPLLETLDIADQLTPKELKLDYMKQDTTYRIMDTQVKNTH